jgi:branched-chain amino acid aminotransferase
MYVAKEYLGMEVEEREVYLDELDSFAECGLCGTAAVISPVGHLRYGDNVIKVQDGGIGPVSQKLYDNIVGIQLGEIEGPKGWVVTV